MKFKKLFFIVSLFSLFAFLSAQEAASPTETSTEITETTEAQNEPTEVSPDSTDNSSEETKKEKNSILTSLNGKIYENPADFNDLIHSIDFIMELTPGFYLNPASKELHSGPSAPLYPISIGITWPNYTFIALQPTFSFFSMYNLWYEGTAYPAEIENRTATTYNHILNFPIVISLYIGKNRIQFLAGPTILARYGFLAGNVDYNDSGFTGSAGEDVKEINKWFWSNAHFLYANIGVAWLRELVGTLKGGPVMNCYLPLGSFFNHEGFLGTVISFGMKISL